MRRNACLIFLTWFFMQTVHAQETEVVYLSGTGPHDARTWDFRLNRGRNSGQWTTIPVPSHWEIQGFGTYEYGHVKHADKVPEIGQYRTFFTASHTWEYQTVRLVFGGVMTDTQVFINGKSTGPRHQGGFYEFKYDITDKLDFGEENDLSVTVHKQSANESVSRAERSADFWTPAGIYRPVWLEVTPREYIDWVSIAAEADGRFRAEVHCANIAQMNSLQAEIRSAGEDTVLKQTSTKLAPGQEYAEISMRIDSPRLWSAETPHLYEVSLRLNQGPRSGHTLSKRCGFRTFEIRKGAGFFLNGQRIVLKGANRHCFHADTGRALSPAMSRRDIELMQDMNMNAVRCSHYPPDSHFLDLCDEMGLYVLDELTGWQKPPYDTEVGRKLVRELVVRDSGHPSILFWDNGNEGGWNTELDDEFARYDAQDRPVLHPWESLSGVNTAHYRNYQEHARILAGRAVDGENRKYNAGDIYLPTEFLHGLHDGGHGAGLDDYWRAVVASPLGGGGFLWALKDEALVRSDRNNALDSAGIAAPDGIIGPRAEQKKGSYYTIKEIWSPVYIERKDLDLRGAPFDGLLAVENRYAFTNLKQCSFTRELVRLSSPGQLNRGMVLSRMSLDAPHVEPGQRGTLDLELPATWREADVLRVTASNPRGRELFTWTWPLGDPMGQTHPRPGVRSQVYTAVVTGSTLAIKTEDRVYRFDTATGSLLGVTIGERGLSLGQGPLLAVAKEKSPYIPAAGPVTVEWDTDANMPTVRARGTNGLDAFQWTLRRDGVLQLDYQYTLPEEVYAFAGITFACPEDDMRGMQWQGDGPYRVYMNRRKGSEFGVHALRYNDPQPGRLYDWPSFKGYFANLYWVQFHTGDGRITVRTDQQDLFLRTYTPKHDMEPIAFGQSPKQNRGAKVPYPDLDLSFLHAIPAIGTKFKQARELGPQSDFNRMGGRYTARLFFAFD